jgi:hypothetical protein
VSCLASRIQYTPFRSRNKTVDKGRRGLRGVVMVVVSGGGSGGKRGCFAPPQAVRAPRRVGCMCGSPSPEVAGPMPRPSGWA